jgi:uncharacterized repeat protein (TIGR02543 family)
MGGNILPDKTGLYFGYAYNNSNNGYYTLPNPTKENAKFMGWYDTPDFSGSPITTSSLVDQYKTMLFAKWSEQITINFELYGGIGTATKSYYPEYAFSNSTYGNTGLPTTPTKDSAKFVGWYATPDFMGSIITNTSYVSSGMSTLYARWAEKVNVVFIDYSQEKVQSKSFWHGLEYYYSPINTGMVSASSPLSPNVSWYHDIVGLEDEMTDSTSVPNIHTTLFARWCIKVHFEVNDGEYIEDRIYTPNTRYNAAPNQGLPIAVRNGYGFEGWYTNAEFTQLVTDNNIVPDSSYTLYAKWKAPTYVQVTFDVNGGNILGNQQYQADGLKYGQLPNVGLPTPTRAGRFAFVGWYSDSELTQKVTNESMVPSVNHTLYAKWNEIPLPKYTVTIAAATGGDISVKNNGATVISGSQVDSGTVLTLLATPNADYNFTKWWDNNTEAGRNFELESNISISATFTAKPLPRPTPKYTVTIAAATNGDISVKNGATTLTSGTQVDSGTVLTLQATPNAGYTFAKWWDNSIEAGRNLTLKAEVSISASFTAIAVTGVELKSATSMVVGGTEQLSAAVQPANAANQNVTWESNNTGVATVSSDGLVTAVSAGTAVITVKTVDGNRTATCTVTVSATAVAVTGVSLNKTTATLTLGSMETLTPTVLPAAATNQNVTWSSSNISVADVTNAGLVIALAEGTAIITVKTVDGNKTATCTVTVSTATVAVISVELNKTTAALTAGATEQLTATVNPNNATNQNVMWESDNNSVATVNSAGLVTAVSVGTAIITVKTADGNKTATCTVTVSATGTNVAVTSVSLNKTTISLDEGDTERLTATVNPNNATNKNVTWESSNTAVATVNSSGRVSAIAEGTATITVKTVDGNKTATCTVTVVAGSSSVAVTSVSLNKATAALTVGATEQLTATINPGNATNKNVTWSSSNTAVATVNSSSGLVTARAVGSAIITVKTADGNKTATCTVTVTSVVTPPTAVGADELLPLTLYPNPVVSGELTIENGELTEGKTIEIYNLNGTLVARYKTVGEVTSLNVSALPGGTYIVRTGRHVGKFVKR